MIEQRGLHNKHHLKNIRADLVNPGIVQRIKLTVN